MASKRIIEEGKVYYPKKLNNRYSFRRVVGVVENRVFYSIGDRVLNCSLLTFIKATKPNAEGVEV